MSKPALSITGPWPRLSDELPLCGPNECAACGSGDELSIWLEHDTGDAPESIYVVICRRCSDAIIDPHPRLYRRLRENEPAPGVMPICRNCAHRAGSRCWHPTSRLRGGRGVKLEHPSPYTAFVDYARKRGRREGGAITVFPGVVYACSGKELTGSTLIFTCPAKLPA